MIDAMNQAVQNAAENLPDGYEVVIRIESGAAWVVLTNTDGVDKDFHYDTRLCDAVNEAVTHAIDEDLRLYSQD